MVEIGREDLIREQTLSKKKEPTKATKEAKAMAAKAKSKQPIRPPKNPQK